MLYGYGNGLFTAQITYSTGSNSSSYSVTVGDFNKDKQLDLAVANFGTKNVGVFLGTGTGMFVPQSAYETGSDRAPFLVTAPDLNHDGQSEVIVAYDDSDNADILIANNIQTFTNQKTYSTGFDSQPSSVDVGDFNNDILLEIIVADYATSDIVILLGYGNGTFGELLNYPLVNGSLPFSVLVGNFNNDRRLDYSVANYGTDNIEVFLQI